ncbi:hypothetical protein NGR_c18580 [Sinorhizobium fredii NGR234]|uniref:Uncharacterized protein n=1 Tax=Sinorhizobium fredii (strain NBRC 101917 / NGR234) TaxID=394 RepID=C3MDV3_SINFN|nr:hypothetical protein NGR_c18580 [Sinorhizobium fredii NGR234]
MKGIPYAGMPFIVSSPPSKCRAYDRSCRCSLLRLMHRVVDGWEADILQRVVREVFQSAFVAVPLPSGPGTCTQVEKTGQSRKALARRKVLVRRHCWFLLSFSKGRDHVFGYGAT